MTSPFRIAHVVHRLDVGGLERVVINLIKHLPRERWEPSLYCLKRGGVLVAELEADGVPVHDLAKKDRLDLALPLRMAGILRREKIDIVHCHNIGALLYGALSARLSRKAGMIYTAHGVYSARRLAEMRFSGLLGIDRVVAVSDDARAVLAQAYAEDRVETVLNGIDTDLYGGGAGGGEVREELGIAASAPVFGIVARLAWEKLHIRLLEAMKQVLEHVPNATLLIIGDGQVRAELEEFTKSNGMTSAVRFLGERHDVPRLLRALDVFVLSSRLEGLSLTLLEAAAAGLPIVATDVGGNSEVVVHGETGLLVAADDPDALALAMLEIIGDPDRAKRMGVLGRQRVVELYSVGTMVKRYETIYDELLGAR